MNNIEKNKVSHTLTPWSVNGRIIERRTNGNAPRPLASLPRYDEAEANAAFIVRAVNAHREMVLTLESVLANIKENKEAFGGSRYSIMTMIEKAIAKAEGK